MKAKPADATYLFSNQDLKRLILPLLVEQLLAITVGMADSIMVSSVGEAAVSGKQQWYWIRHWPRSLPCRTE